MKTIENKIDRETNKSKTDIRTWNFVTKFWTLECDVEPELIEKVFHLEARMEAEHGWKR